MQIYLLAATGLAAAAFEGLPSPLEALFGRFLAPDLAPGDARASFGDADDVTQLMVVPQQGVLSDNEALAILDSINPFISSFSGFMHRLKPSLLDPFALLPGIMMMPEKFELPNVTISDAECLITINLNGMDMNSTSIRVYSSDSDVSVEITNTHQASSQKSNRGPTFSPLEEEEQPTNSESISEEEVDVTSIESLFNLRGSSITSSFTTIRSFPAPVGCDLTSEASKATIDEKEGNLLVKFPKLASREENESLEHIDAVNTKGVVSPQTADVESGAENQDQLAAQAIIRSALAVEDGSASSGAKWLRNLFGGKGSDFLPVPVKVPVPLVRYDEF